MKYLSRYLMTTLLISMACQLHAQQPAQLVQKRKAVAAAEDELHQARMRLENAAREVAAVSSEGPMSYVINTNFTANRAMLGINIGGKNNDGNSDGVEVLGVTPDSPADEAGLRAGDVILKIDDQSLAADNSSASSEKLLRHMADVEPGAKVNVEYIRDGKTRKTDVTTSKIPNIFIPYSRAVPVIKDLNRRLELISPGHIVPVALNRWGDMELAGLTPGLGKYFGTDKGVLVMRAPSNDGLQLEDGDVILSIDGREPNDPVHALRIIRSYEPGESMKLEIMRDKRKQKLDVSIPEIKNEMLGIYQDYDGHLNNGFYENIKDRYERLAVPSVTFLNQPLEKTRPGITLVKPVRPQPARPPAGYSIELNSDNVEKLPKGI